MVFFWPLVKKTSIISVSPCLIEVTIEVRGTTAVGKTFSPRRLLMKVDFPLLNCPNTTRWKWFPVSFSEISCRFSWILSSPLLEETEDNLSMQPIRFWRICLYRSSTGSLQNKGPARLCWQGRKYKTHLAAPVGQVFWPPPQIIFEVGVIIPSKREAVNGRLHCRYFDASQESSLMSIRLWCFSLMWVPITQTMDSESRARQIPPLVFWTEYTFHHVDSHSMVLGSAPT